jgi:hypothetical protein
MVLIETRQHDRRPSSFRPPRRHRAHSLNGSLGHPSAHSQHAEHARLGLSSADGARGRGAGVRGGDSRASAHLVAATLSPSWTDARLV